MFKGRKGRLTLKTGKCIMPIGECAKKDFAMARGSDSFRFLFYPRSVAVIGASGNPLKMGHQCMLSLRESAFSGPIYPIHPQDKELLGIKAYPSLERAPGVVALAILV